MSNSSSHNDIPSASSGVRPEILRVLDDLRSRIRKYVLLEGVAAVLVLLGCVFWISLGFDVAWFQISKLELPLWFRRLVMVLACVLFGLTLVTWIGFRYLRRFQAKALALVLERRFPELDDRLVTAVEMATSGQSASGALGGAMLERTIADAASRAESLDLGSVFDRRPLRRALIAAVVLMTSILGFGVTNVDAMQRWYAAYVTGVENYWEAYRRSEMTVQILAPPRDRVREFDDEFRYKHPRGADLTVLVTVREGKEVPDRVTLRHQAVNGDSDSRGAVTMSRAGERQFRHTLGRVIEDHELWIVGGDFTNRLPFRIEVVEPPRIDRIELDVDYPSYTGMDALEDQPVLVQGARQTLPMETSFVLRAQANKPLTAIEIRSERFLLAAEWASKDGVQVPGDWTLTLNDPRTNETRRVSLPVELLPQRFSRDRRAFLLPLHLSLKAEEELDRMFEAATGDNPRRDWPDLFPLVPGSRLEVSLRDEDDVESFEPAMVVLEGTPDQAPVVDVVLGGIGQRITRLATIPFRGRLLDDYGVQEAWFRFQLDDSEAAETAPLVKPPRGETRFELQRSEREKAERFDVLPLQLEPGRKLSLSINARDGDNLNGPHETQGQPFTFSIVTEDELHADLYDKEMNLRLRFEHIRNEVDLIRTDLLLSRGRYAEGTRLGANPPADRPEAALREEQRQIRIALQAGADRSLNRIRKDHSESREVEQRFRDIREELVNNRVDTEASRSRLDQGIIGPLATLNGTTFPQADERIALLSLTIERGQDPTAAIDEAVIALDRIVSEIDAILAQMSERRDFNEVVQELQLILERLKKVQEQTERERQRSVIDSLFD